MNPYECQYVYQIEGEKYNSKATDSVRHSRVGYWATDPYYDENEYTIGTVRYADFDGGYSYNENDYSAYNSQHVHGYNSGARVAYGGQQAYAHSYYRGNGGDLRVWDRPFDIVSASASVRGGISETYTNQYWGASSGATLMIVLAIAVLGIGAYLLGRRTAI